jgi:hypothetical protein
MVFTAHRRGRGWPPEGTFRTIEALISSATTMGVIGLDSGCRVK